jgi:hypothetical protein
MTAAIAETLSRGYFRNVHSMGGEASRAARAAAESIFSLEFNGTPQLLGMMSDIAVATGRSPITQWAAHAGSLPEDASANNGGGGGGFRIHAQRPRAYAASASAGAAAEPTVMFAAATTFGHQHSSSHAMPAHWGPPTAHLKSTLTTAGRMDLAFRVADQQVQLASFCTSAVRLVAEGGSVSEEQLHRLVEGLAEPVTLKTPGERGACVGWAVFCWAGRRLPPSWTFSP